MKKIFVLVNHSIEWLEFIRPLLSNLVGDGNYSKEFGLCLIWESEFSYELLKSEIDCTENLIIPSEKFIKGSELAGVHRSYFIRARSYPDNDRIRYWRGRDISEEATLSYISAIETAVEGVFDSDSILIYESISCMAISILADIITSSGGSYIGFQQARVPGFTAVYNDNGFFSMNDSAFSSEFLSQQPVPDSFQKPEYIKGKSKRGARLLSKYTSKHNVRRLMVATQFLSRSTFQLGTPMRAYLSWFIKGLERLANYYIIDRTLPRLTKAQKYFVYPMHFHPEASTSWFAWWVPSEIEFIDILTRALRFDEKLVVKMHPSASGQLSYLQYRKLKNNPCIEIVSSEADLDKLLQSSLGLITINGTAVFDAMNASRPSLVFGDFPVFVDGMIDGSLTNSLDKQVDMLRDQKVEDRLGLIRLYTSNCYPKEVGDLNFKDILLISKIISFK